MPKKLPLSGYRVVDFTSVVAGPWCTRLLADCGAEVIKIESPGMGDVLRFSEPVNDGQSRVFAHFNAGKKGVCLNLKSDQGVEVARDLIRSADIVVENFRPGVMSRLGLDYENIVKANQNVIYCSISGFGQSGPMAKAPAYAPVLHALSGFDHVLSNAQADQAVPLNSGIMVADFMAASYAFGAIQSAVIQRERFGMGEFIDVCLMDAMLSLVAIQCQEAQSDKAIKSTVFRPVAVADGHVMIPLVSHKNYVELLKAIGNEALLADPKIKSFSGVLELRPQILKALEAWSATKTSQQVIEVMADAGLPCARYRAPAENLDDPHLLQRGSFTTLQDAAGSFSILSAPFRLSSTTLGADRVAARLGEHNEEVLQSIGRVAADIEELREAGAIA